jgi:hypothetical protein
VVNCLRRAGLALSLLDRYGVGLDIAAERQAWREFVPHVDLDTAEERTRWSLGRS